MRTKNTRKGFTTVELVIVIAVIAILATVLIPTFSNMIEKANLSVDKQNVRNMNLCLVTESITDGNPSDFGKVKDRLQYYGYGKDDNFVPKSKGYSISWYTDDKNDDDKTNDISVILLLDADGAVVFPEEYVGDNTIRTDNVRMCFDLSLPAAKVEENWEPAPVVDAMSTALNRVPTTENLAVMYTFYPARDESTQKYSEWYADFHIRFEDEDGNPIYKKQDVQSLLKDAGIAGYYCNWSIGSGSSKIGDFLTNEEDWLFFSVTDDAPDKAYEFVDILGREEEVALLLAMAQVSDPDAAAAGTVPRLKYSLLPGLIENEEGKSIFKCGVVDKLDEDYDDPADNKDKGITMFVELRLTNPAVADNSDYVVVGMYEYTFQ